MQFGQYTQIIPLQLLHKAITVTYSLDQQNNNINLQKFAFPSPSPKATTHIRIQETKWVSDNDGFKQKQFINKYYSHTIIKSDAQLFILTSLLNATGLYISMDNQYITFCRIQSEAQQGSNMWKQACSAQSIIACRDIDKTVHLTTK